MAEAANIISNGLSADALNASKLESAADCRRDENGWRAHLHLAFKSSDSITQLGTCQHYGPLRVQRPFYPEGNLAHVYILHPPGGVVGGDQLNIEVNVQANAQALCTTPGSGKFYLSAGCWALLQQHLKVEAGASLEWLPQENILFAGAKLHARTIIELEADAKFIGWEINCLGRPGCGEIFDQGAFDSRLEFYHNKKLILIENQRVLNAQMLNAATGLRGEPMQGTLFAFPCAQVHLESARTELAKQQMSTLAAATLIDGLLVVRVLGSNNETVTGLLTALWKTLRPLLLDRQAVAPRIWAT